ncbi:hypothetical protein ABZ671_25270 [Micromonospora sp. NPDC006766]|uniref:hypothetical protein n=1 Tax=Micromonospora sp. NPDC006766 TaxID=3154778 RepID=UPI00340A1F8A
MTPVEICRTVLAGITPAAAVPELGDDDVRREVSVRLQNAGCELAYSPVFDCWTARFAGPFPDIDAVDSAHPLNSADLAVLAACWLHLRFLPAENTRLLPADGEGDALFALPPAAESGSIEFSDLAQQFPTLPPRNVGISVGKLRRLRYLDQREGRVFAGPLLDSLDDLQAAEQARRLLLRHQRMRHLAVPVLNGYPVGNGASGDKAEGRTTDATD